MSEPLPPLPPNVPYHPAPPQGWRPISGLAVTAFVLSIVCILLSVLGLWISQAVPLALAVFTLVTVKADRRRGRLLAIWAIIIAVTVGSCSYSVHATMRKTLGGMGEALLAALSSDVSDEEKDDALRGWIYAPTLEENPGLLADMRARYEKVVELLGPYGGSVDLGTPYFGAFALLKPPPSVFEIGADPKERPRTYSPGEALWMKAAFERGVVHVAVVIKTRDEQSMAAVSELGPEATVVPIVQDVRFFRERGEMGP